MPNTNKPQNPPLQVFLSGGFWDIFLYLFLRFPLSKALLSETGHKLYIEFSYIKALDVFAVEIYHVAMGDSPASLRSEKRIVRPPAERGFRDESIIRSVVMLVARFSLEPML